MTINRVTGQASDIWWPKLEQCAMVHPSKQVACDLHKGHAGAHTNHSVTGRVEWIDPLEITIEHEIHDNASLLDWAKAKNPKLFKTSTRNVASDECLTADARKHKRCTAPWCECPCHDDRDIMMQHPLWNVGKG